MRALGGEEQMRNYPWEDDWKPDDTFELAVKRIQSDLNDRRGFDLRSIDEETQREIFDRWYDILRETLDQ